MEHPPRARPSHPYPLCGTRCGIHRPRYSVRRWQMNLAKRKIKYRIHAFPSQRRFYEDSAKYVGFSGPVGSGKTVALVNKARQMAVENPGCLGLLGAPTMPMLESVTIRTMLDILGMRR